VQRALRGQDPEEEFARSFDEYWELALRICRSRLPRTIDAEDAAQETLLRFLRADHSRIRSARPWIAAVAIRVCNETHRLRYKRNESSLNLDVQVSHVETSAGIRDVEGSLWIAQAIADLHVSDRQLLSWLYVDDFAPKDVANRLGLSDVGLRVAAFRARQRARSLILSDVDYDGPAHDVP